MNYFNKTRKKRVPKLDRPNSSSSSRASQDLFLSRDSSNCRGTEKAVRRSEEAEESFELLSPRSNRSFTPSFLVVAYHTQRNVCVCVCVAAKGECLLEKDGTGRWFSPGCIDFRYLAGEEFNASLLCNAPSRGTSRAVKLLTGGYDSRISFSYP